MIECRRNGSGETYSSAGVPPGIAIALDDNCALEIVDGNYRLISSKRKVGAKRVYNKNNKDFAERLDVLDKYTPLSSLIKK